ALMVRVEKVATPATAATLVVPPSVPPPGLVPMAMATVAVEVVTVFPNASCTSTATAGEMAAPTAVLLGCWANASRLAAPAVMLKGFEVAEMRRGEEATNV